MSSLLSSAALSSGSSVIGAGSSLINTGSSAVGSSDAEVVGSSAEVLGTLGSSGLSGVLDTVQHALQLRDFLDPVLGLF